MMLTVSLVSLPRNGRKVENHNKQIPENQNKKEIQ